METIGTLFGEYLEVIRSTASETDVIEGRVVHQESAIRPEASLHSADAVQTLGAVLAPSSASVSFAPEFPAVGAHEPHVVDGRVVGRVAVRHLPGWTDSHPETLHVRSCSAFTDGLPIAETENNIQLNLYFKIDKLKL
jgi:hypothetical protein